jgi:hypothetical protein
MFVKIIFMTSLGSLCRKKTTTYCGGARAYYTSRSFSFRTDGIRSRDNSNSSIAINSFFTLEKNGNMLLQKTFSVLGEPAIALSVGVLLVLTTIRKWTKHDVSKFLQEGAEKADGILVIIGAGGAFGAVQKSVTISALP